MAKLQKTFKAVFLLVLMASCMPQPKVIEDKESKGGQDFFQQKNPPTISTVVPVSGPTSGGTLINIIGTDFQMGAAVLLNNKMCLNVNVLSAVHIQCITPDNNAGIANIMVTNPDAQQALIQGAFTYVGNNPAPQPDPAPTLTAVIPNMGDKAGGTAINVLGTNFKAGASVMIGSSPCANVNVVSETQIQCITSASQQIGPVLVRVTNSDAQFADLANGFIYEDNQVVVLPPPTIADINPTKGPLAGGTQIFIAGTGFQVGVQVKIGNLDCANISRLSDTVITCLSPAQNQAGLVPVSVINPDNQSVVNSSPGFTYEAANNVIAPTISNIAPSKGPVAGGTPIVISGTGFVNGNALNISIGGVDCVNTLFVSNTQINCTTPANTVGQKIVSLVNGDNQNAVNITPGFTYEAAEAPAPTLISVNPNQGPIAGGTLITLQGNNIQQGASINLNGVACANVMFVSSSQIRCTTPAIAAAAVVSINLVNPDNKTATLANAFTYVQPVDNNPPTVPANLATTSVTDSSVSLSWNASTDLEGRVVSYDVFRDGVELANVIGRAFIDNNLQAATQYTYMVRATDNSGNKSNFASLNVTTLQAAEGPCGQTSIAFYDMNVKPIFNNCFGCHGNNAAAAQLNLQGNSVNACQRMRVRNLLDFQNPANSTLIRKATVQGVPHAGGKFNWNAIQIANVEMWVQLEAQPGEAAVAVASLNGNHFAPSGDFVKIDSDSDEVLLLDSELEIQAVASDVSPDGKSLYLISGSYLYIYPILESDDLEVSSKMKINLDSLISKSSSCGADKIEADRDGNLHIYCKSLDKILKLDSIGKLIQ
jgi:hypothetical protein